MKLPASASYGILWSVAFLFLGTACGASLELVAGGGVKVEGALPHECRLIQPFGVEFDPAGRMFIAEMVKGNRVLMVDRTLSVVAGTGEKGFAGDGGPARQATFNGMHNLAIAPNGDIYLADTWNYRVRKIERATGKIFTVAGTGKKEYSGDGGPAAEASFSSIIQIALDSSGRNLFVADIENRRIRKISLETGIVSTVAGNGSRGVPRDGEAAVSAPLVDPRAVLPAGDGSFHVLERNGHALRFVDQDGRIRTVAGTGRAGFSGDGGDALAAELRGPKHLCYDAAGDVIIADTDNHAVRKLHVKTGIIERIAGSGKAGSKGLGGDPLQAELNQPHGVTVHRDGSLYITDSYNDRILRIVP